MSLGHGQDLKDVNSINYIVLAMTPVHSIDYAAAMVLGNLVRELHTRGIEMRLPRSITG